MICSKCGHLPWPFVLPPPDIGDKCEECKKGEYIASVVHVQTRKKSTQIRIDELKQVKTLFTKFLDDPQRDIEDFLWALDNRIERIKNE